MKKIVCLLLTFLFVLPCFALCVVADETPLAIMTSDVEDDLEGFGFDMDDYPVDQTVTSGDEYVSLEYVLEYGYNYRGDQTNYRLILYIYNPSGHSLQTVQNKVQIAFGKQGGGFSNTVKFNLQLLDESASHRFGKYLVSGISQNTVNQLQRNCRKYRISGIEVNFGGGNICDYKISGEYSFTGYLPKYGLNKDDTTNPLMVSWNKFDTLSLELHPVSYLAESVTNVHDEVSGVYFSMPNWYLKKYGTFGEDCYDQTKGGLYSVHGEFEEYKINGIVTDDSFVATFLNTYKNQFSSSLYSVNIPLCFDVGREYVERSYNLEPFAYDSYNVPLHGFNASIYKSTFDDVSSQEILNSVSLDYTGNGANGDFGMVKYTYPISGFGPPVMTKIVDAGRTFGLQEFTVTATDLLNVSSSTYRSWWKKLWGASFSNTDSIQGIEMVQTNLRTLEQILGYTDSAISSTFHINESDVEGFKTWCEGNLIDGTNLIEGAIGSTGYIVRFANTETYIGEADVYNGSSKLSGNHYYFEKTVFQNFDILDVTFQDKNGQQVTVAVVADPVDIAGSLPSPGEVNGQKPSKGDNSFWEEWGKLNNFAKALILIAGLVVLVLILNLVTGFFAPVTKLAGLLIALPVKAVKGVYGAGKAVAGSVDRAGDRKEKKYDRNRKRTEDNRKDDDYKESKEDKQYQRTREQVFDTQKFDENKLRNETAKYNLEHRKKTDEYYDKKRENGGK